ncbi:MAG TPA: hypothetical protein VMR02_09090 [Terracidiphilus sp.]|jgi:hypothetical protein|nr:hypothetical protein [Terracidiphilus sp.]
MSSHTLAALAVAAGLAGTNALSAQQSFSGRFAAHNADMAKLQPAMVTPLVAADPRLIQYYRFAFSHQYTAADTETTNYGNARGGGIIVANRFELDWLPPAYIQHNSTAIDGFGDTSIVAKARIVSGDAEHGNFDVAASLAHCFATGGYKNGALTDSFTPTLAGDYTFRHLSFISALSETLPTGKIAAQGRSIAWNELTQLHATPHIWFEVENNATFYFAGPHDGKIQNFVTPAAFYVLRRKEWASTHPFAFFASGMQIATSGFHTYNHNLISEVRILF